MLFQTTTSCFQQLPKHINITFEDIEYQIYITEDTEFCTFCKKYGHSINDCRAKNNTKLTIINTEPNTHENENTNITNNENTNTLDTTNTHKEESQLTITQKTNQTLQENENTNNIHNEKINTLDKTNNQKEEPQLTTTQETNQLSDHQQNEQKIVELENEVQILHTQKQKEEEPKKQQESEINANTHTEQEKHLNQTVQKGQLPSGSNDSLLLDGSCLDLQEPSQKNTGEELSQSRQNKKPKGNNRNRSISPRNVESTDEIITIIKPIYLKNKYSIEFDTFKNTFENILGHNDPLKVIRDHMNVDTFIEIARDLHKHTQKNIKSRLTKIINKIILQLGDEEEDC